MTIVLLGISHFSLTDYFLTLFKLCQSPDNYWNFFGIITTISITNHESDDMREKNVKRFESHTQNKHFQL